MNNNRDETAAVIVVVLALLGMAVLPFVLPAERESLPAGAIKQAHAAAALTGGKAGKSAKSPAAAGAAPVPSAASATQEGADSSDESRKGAHGHDLDPAAPHWYLTVHGTDEMADVFALDANGRVIGGILGPVPAGHESLRELRGIALTGDGRLAVLNAYMQNSRALLFGAPNEQGMRPFASMWVQQSPANNGFMHPYQIAVGPDGDLFASNQDTNTVTRYRGLGTPQPGQPAPTPAGLAGFGTLYPGTVVPNSQHSPEGIHEIRGIAFGPDGLLYVADRAAAEVVSFDPATGRRVRVVMSSRDGLGHPIQLLFTPDHQYLLVSDNENQCVWRIDLQSGKIGHLVTPKSGGLDEPSALAIEGDRLYVGSRLGKAILRYRLQDGRFEGVFARLQGNPEFLISTQQK